MSRSIAPEEIKKKRIVKIVKNGYLRSGWPFSSSSKTEPGSAALDWKNDEAPVNSENKFQTPLEEDGYITGNMSGTRRHG